MGWLSLLQPRKLLILNYATITNSMQEGYANTCCILLAMKTSRPAVLYSRWKCLISLTGGVIYYCSTIQNQHVSRQTTFTLGISSRDALQVNGQKSSFSQWQWSETSTMDAFLHPKRKYPTAAPNIMDPHSHELYVITMSMRKYASVTCTRCNIVSTKWANDHMFVSINFTDDCDDEACEMKNSPYLSWQC